MHVTIGVGFTLNWADNDSDMHQGRNATLFTIYSLTLFASVYMGKKYATSNMLKVKP